ncbi:hypothetical protein Tsubulata_010210 [Turnera subulata]|uniref:Glycolipid transfer protein domain-containing protein n=1 Tax=Turnera subulata TaxID=218843 RepID=A0A9Q0FI14_9ROSI|nr:hypothetical protein Tsubulata_010210 [Turnera subulata]
MKRGREVEKQSEIKSAIEELSMLTKLKPSTSGDDDHGATAHIPTRPFLYICNLVIQVLDKIGPTMAVLRQDIDQNIQRLERQCDSDPSLYSNLVEIVKEEVNQGNARKGPSCSKALVWLTSFAVVEFSIASSESPDERGIQNLLPRSLEFTVALLQRLAKDCDQDMEQAVEESYNITLKQWHGWISSAAFKVALKLVPDNKTFIDLLMTKDETEESFKADIQTLISLLVNYLEEIRPILRSYGLEKLKST